MNPGNPAIRRSRTIELVPEERLPAEPDGFDEALMETKLHPPAIRDGLVERPDLDARLEAAPAARVTVVSAPTGYGKTTLLSSWARRRSDPVAWLTVEAADNDPVRFLQHLVGSFERAGSIPRPPRPRSPVAPGIDVLATVIARLVNQLGARTESVVLIVDDYQALSDARCHSLMQSLIEGSPTTLRFVLATRADPSLPLGRWRAQGNLLEIRQADLRFGTDEARRFLNGVLGLALDEADVVALDERAEGWPAGLYLAAMSLRGQADRAGFIRRFAGSNRHLVDYLGPEVLGPVDQDTRTFLLRTAWLERLTGPLCDAVTDADDSAERLRQLYRDNLFLTALDDDGVWYRYHRLFAELLRSILASEMPDLVPELHRRAAAWHGEHGGLEQSVRHLLRAGRHEEACVAIARGWRELTATGQFETLHALLEAIGPDRRSFTAPLAYVEAINSGLRGLDQDVLETLLGTAERAPWDGPTPDGFEAVSVGVAVARASFIGQDLGASAAAARLLVGRQSEAPDIDGLGRAALGICLVLRGEPEAATEVMEGFTSYPWAPLVELLGLAARALAVAMQGDPQRSAESAERAFTQAREWGLDGSQVGGAVALAMGVSAMRLGRTREAQPLLEAALRQWGGRPGTLPRAYVALWLAGAVAANGEAARARDLAREARAIVSRSPDPGAIPSLMEQVERALRVPSRRATPRSDVPTEAEIRVLRLLAGTSSRSEIARQLFLSPNTVKSHVKAINRKLGTSSRAEAVARAREMDII